MARPPKVGLEYFSLDVKMDDEVEIIKGQYGIEGFGILIAMYQSIYADKGYYKKWNERNQILFSNKISTDRNLVVTVIDDCIKWDIFNQNLYERHKILTSKRIQKQYVGATYKRSEVELIEEYLLLKEKDIDRKNISCIRVSDNRNSKVTNVSDSKSTQSNKDKDKDKDINKYCSDSVESANESIEIKFDSETMPYKAAKYLRELILENNSREPVPGESPKELEDWAVELDRLNRLGPVGAKNKGYSWKEIGRIMEWSQDHHFWKQNIKSASKLRKQITRLEDQMKSGGKDKNNQNEKDDRLARIYKKYKDEEESVDVL